MKDYLDTATYPELAGIDYKIEWNAVETVTLKDVVESVNGVCLSSSVSSSESITRSTGNSGGVSLSINTNYLAELASSRDVDHYDTKWMEPASKNGSNVIVSPSYNNTKEDKGWKHDRVIQAGANAGQLIHIAYGTYRLANLGIADSGVLTGQDATQAISEIESASEIVAEQRNLFGSYQNRLEHAMSVDAETAENLQASESRIRDADMADEALENARNTIMEQSMQAMLANANHQLEEIRSLLPL